MVLPIWFTAVVLANAPTGPPVETPEEMSGQWGINRHTDPAPLVSMEVVADVASAGPDQTFLLGVHLSIAKGWHIYWESPGDSGSPTIVDVQAPHGWTVGPTQYPRPTRFTAKQSVTWGYESEVVLLVEVTSPPAALDPPQFTPASFDVFATWLVCKDVCHMGDAQKVCTVEMVGTVTSSLQRFARWQSRIPRPIADLPGAVVTVTEGLVTLTGTIDDADQATFIPLATPGVQIAPADSTGADDQLAMTIPFTADEDNALGGDLRLRGLLAIGNDPQGPSWEINVELPRSGDTQP